MAKHTKSKTAKKARKAHKLDKVKTLTGKGARVKLVKHAKRKPASKKKGKTAKRKHKPLVLTCMINLKASPTDHKVFKIAARKHNKDGNISAMIRHAVTAYALQTKRTLIPKKAKKAKKAKVKAAPRKTVPAKLLTKKSPSSISKST